MFIRIDALKASIIVEESLFTPTIPEVVIIQTLEILKKLDTSKPDTFKGISKVACELQYYLYTRKIKNRAYVPNTAIDLNTHYVADYQNNHAIRTAIITLTIAGVYNSNKPTNERINLDLLTSAALLRNYGDKFKNPKEMEKIKD